MQQTIVQENRSLRFGSGKFEVGDDIGSLVNLGAMRGINFSESWDKIEIESDNAGRVTAAIRNQRAALAGDLMEINLVNLYELRGGIDNYVATPGTLVGGAAQLVAQGNWGFNDFIKIENQNHDGTAITVNSVTGSVDGALTVDNDYYVGQNEDKEWGIFVADGLTATTEGQNLTINYDYTPAASRKFTSGGRVTINPKVVRVTNTNAEGKIFRITVFKATVEEGISIELQSDESGEVATTPINLVGTLDDSRAVGEQLFEIYDEQTA